ncbi:hypothetical protein Acsp01_17330 [Actinoplanes sp. NBRC 101535]|nr:hypothetical protein Acsp01_17330 [Actinoplanes sp. NBRC 101535]
MNRVDQRPAESRPDLGQQVEHLHHALVCSSVEIVDPVADLIDEEDVPFIGRNPAEYSER